jgi:hypothetical protein
MSRMLTLTLKASILAACFLLAAVITAYACSVTNRTIIESNLNDCKEEPYFPVIHKYELNRITFSDGDFDNVPVYGLVLAIVHRCPTAGPNVTHNSTPLSQVNARQASVIASAGVNSSKA